MPDPLVDRLRASLAPAYELERELGGGGMSRVFVARETALGRTVVVKVVAPEIGAGVSAERFRREVQLAARLQHPNIVPLFSAGSDGELLWYTMPLVEGETLRDRLRREGRLRVIDALRLWREMLAALAHAHARGIVHRDVKPENVLLTGGGRAVVTDFGIAKALDVARDVDAHGRGTTGDATGEATGEATGDATGDATAERAAAPPSPVDGAPPAPPGYALTASGMAIGTPAYMAPEQAVADPAADERVDLYSAGLLMYEMLAGRGPFTGARTPRQQVAAHLSQPPRPLEVPNLPPRLAELVMRCLAKDPAERPRGAQALLDEADALEREFITAAAVALGMATSTSESARGVTPQPPQPPQPPRAPRAPRIVTRLWERATDVMRRRGGARPGDDESGGGRG